MRFGVQRLLKAFECLVLCLLSLFINFLVQEQAFASPVNPFIGERICWHFWVKENPFASTQSRSHANKFNSQFGTVRRMGSPAPNVGALRFWNQIMCLRQRSCRASICIPISTSHSNTSASSRWIHCQVNKAKRNSSATQILIRFPLPEALSLTKFGQFHCLA